MLAEKITAELQQALRTRDTLRLSTLRMLKSALEYHKIEKKLAELSDADVIAVIKKQLKQRQDAIEDFEKGGRADLAEKEKAELAILKSYLPEELSRAEIEEIVAGIIAELGAKTKADFGRVMKAVQARTAGRADNRLLSQIISSRLE